MVASGALLRSRISRERRSIAGCMILPCGMHDALLLFGRNCWDGNFVFLFVHLCGDG